MAPVRSRSVLNVALYFLGHSSVKMSSFSRPAKLSFNDFDAVGVDLDHTLCKYKLDNTFPLIYKSLAEAVVSRKGYSAELLEPFDKDKDFCTKGLVFDAKKGNFLKLSREGDILRASHGTTPLSQVEVCEIYGSQARWEHFDFLKDTLKQTGRKRISIDLSITTSFVTPMPVAAICDKVTFFV
ncbi:5'-nucleotidase domain-containing protein 1-like [Lytechinus variegatus]|uniref:5'-nucleotidase domain-containing protein 1-like n=1 Tax=Lytechinus variegatus TaxID=7654 RepID=UPI001BB12757|nr:5'-nucleotidase domain-containing protein 1-like [Lytechinus variegatus]